MKNERIVRYISLLDGRIAYFTIWVTPDCPSSIREDMIKEADNELARYRDSLMDEKERELSELRWNK